MTMLPKAWRDRFPLGAISRLNQYIRFPPGTMVRVVGHHPTNHYGFRSLFKVRVETLGSNSERLTVGFHCLDQLTPLEALAAEGLDENSESIDGI